jgi:hypothetical protein
VEMEAAALSTIGRYRGADVAAAFVISDHLLAEDRWTHAFATPHAPPSLKPVIVQRRSQGSGSQSLRNGCGFTPGVMAAEAAEHVRRTWLFSVVNSFLYGQRVP